MFQSHFYHETIRNTVVAFGTLFDDIKVHKLKAYLASRNSKCSGRKDELIARVFSVNEAKIPAAKSAEQIQAD